MHSRIIALALTFVLSCPIGLAQDVSWQDNFKGGVDSCNNQQYERAESLLSLALNQIEQNEPVDGIARALILSWLAHVHELQNHDATAEELYKRSIDSAERAGQNSPGDIFAFKVRLANFYKSRKRYEDALACYRDALAVQKKDLPAGHPDLVGALDDAATVLFILGSDAYRASRYRVAEDYMLQALSLCESRLLTPSARARCLELLGMIYDAQGRAREAKEMYLKAKPVYDEAVVAARARQPVEPGHLAWSLYRLACIYRHLGKPEESIPLLLEAEGASAKDTACDQMLRGEICFQLAGCYRSLNKDSEATDFYQKQLTICQNRQPPDEEGMASALNGLGSIAYRARRYDDAQAYINQALSIRRRYAEQHPLNLARCLQLLGHIYKSQNRPREAAAAYKQARSFAQKGGSPDDPLLADFDEFLGASYGALGSIAREEQLKKEALERRRASLPANHPDVVRSIRDLAWLYKSQRRYEEAEPLCKEVLAALSQTLPPDHADIAAALDELGELYLLMRRYPDAETAYTRAVSIRERQAGVGARALVQSRQGLARACLDMRRYQQARRALMSAIRVAESQLGKDDVDLCICKALLAEAALGQGKVTESIALLRSVVADSKHLSNEERSLLVRKLLAVEMFGQAVRQPTGLFGQKEKMFNELIELVKREQPVNELGLAVALNLLAAAYWRQGRYADADRIGREALAACRRSKQKGDEVTRQCLQTLIYANRDRQRYREAKRFLLERLSVLETSKEQSGEDWITTFRQLGMACESLGEYEIAESYYRRGFAFQRDLVRVKPQEQTRGPLLSPLGVPLIDLMRRQQQEMVSTEAKPSTNPLRARVQDLLASLREISTKDEMDQATGVCSKAEELVASMPASNDELLAADLWLLAEALCELGHYPCAKPLYERSCKIIELKHGADSAELADRLLCVALRSHQLDGEQPVMPAFARVVRIRQHAFGADSLPVAEAEIYMSSCLGDLGGMGDALAQEAYRILHKRGHQLRSSLAESNDVESNGPHVPTGHTVPRSAAMIALWLDVVSSLADYLSTNHKHDESLEMADLGMAIALNGNALPVPAQVQFMLWYSRCCAANGRRIKARDALDQAMKLAANTPQREDDEACSASLAGLRAEEGDWAQAVAELERLLGSSEGGTGTTAGLFGPAVSLLVSCYWQAGRRDDAVKRQRSILNALEQTPNVPESVVARNWLMLGGLLVENQSYAEADAALKRAEQLCSGGDHPSDQLLLAEIEHAQGLLNSARGEHSVAAQSFAREYEILSKEMSAMTLGSIRPAVECLNARAVEEAQCGHSNEATDSAFLAANIIDSFLSSGFFRLPFSEQCEFSNVVSKQVDMLLTLCTDDVSLGQTYEYLLHWKGLPLESLRRQTHLLDLAKDSKSRHLVRTLQQKRRDVIDCAPDQEPVQIGENAHNKWYRQLLEDERVLEHQLSHSLAAPTVIDPILYVGPQEFANKLKQDEAFIDIYKFHPVGGAADKSAYVAFVVTRGGDPVLVRLGDTKEVEEKVAAWFGIVSTRPGPSRSAQSLLSKASGSAVSNIAGAGTRADGAREVEVESLDAEQRDVHLESRPTIKSSVDPELLQEQVSSKLWGALCESKFRDVLPSISRMWICADSELGKVPWGVMVGQSTSDTIEVCEVGSPREFLSLARRPLDWGTLLVVRGPGLQYGQQEVSAIEDRVRRQGIKVITLEGERATKDNVLAMLPQVRRFHLLGHGTFSGAMGNRRSTAVEGFVDRLTRAAGGTGDSVASDPMMNPLTASYVELAQAKGASGPPRRGSSKLTAQDFLSTDLHRCGLVTLSACHTASGMALVGQGIIGLRSSIVAAGARAVIMSLWAVDDEATSVLQSVFDHNLATMPPAKALREAQKSVQHNPAHKEWQDPYYWAGWTIVGNGF